MSRDSSSFALNSTTSLSNSPPLCTNYSSTLRRDTLSFPSITAWFLSLSLSNASLSFHTFWSFFSCTANYSE